MREDRIRVDGWKNTDSNPRGSLQLDRNPERFEMAIGCELSYSNRQSIDDDFHFYEVTHWSLHIRKVVKPLNLPCCIRMILTQFSYREWP